MSNAKTLFDSLLGQANAMVGGQGIDGLSKKAKGAWDGQSALGKGAIAGGLLGLLLTGSGKNC